MREMPQYRGPRTSCEALPKQITAGVSLTDATCTHVKAEQSVLAHHSSKSLGSAKMHRQYITSQGRQHAQLAAHLLRGLCSRAMLLTLLRQPCLRASWTISSAGKGRRGEKSAAKIPLICSATALWQHWTSRGRTSCTVGALSLSMTGNAAAYPAAAGLPAAGCMACRTCILRCVQAGLLLMQVWT